MNILDLNNDNSGLVFFECSAKLQQGRWDAHLHQGEILRWQRCGWKWSIYHIQSYTY